MTAMTLPTHPHGLLHEVPEDEYHAHRGSLSVTGAKTLLRAPALFQHQQQNPVFKREFDFGSAAHKEVLGVGPDVVIVQRQVRNRKGELLDVVDAADYKSESAREHRDAIRAEGGLPLLRSEQLVVEAMALQLARHRLAMRLLSEGEAEVSAFCEDDDTGVVRRGRFDWLGASILSDYKSAVSSDPDAFVRAAIKFGYHMQASWYLDLAGDLGHAAQAFAFIVQEKEPPYLVTVIELPADLVEIGRHRNRVALQRFRDCVEADQWPGYVPDDTFATPAAPMWALREEQPA